MRVPAASVLLIAGLLATAGAQPPLQAQAPVGLAERARLVLTRYGMYGLSGCVVVAHEDTVLVQECFGASDRATAARNTAETLFDIGSITKTFTAAAVLDLVQAGSLSLDTRLSSLLDNVPPDKRDITLHQLQTHSAGLPLDAADAGIAPTYSRDEFVAKALAVKLIHSPGSAYSYSNLGYGLLAIVIERRAQESFRAYVNRVIQRAGLKHATWWSEVTFADLPGAARGYLMSDREDVLEPEPGPRKTSDTAHSWGKYFLGPAGVLTTAAELHRWVRALVGGRVLGDAMTSAMFTPYIGDEAYGWHVGERAGIGRRFYRGGLRGGFTSLAAYYPDRRVTLTFTLNHAQSGWESLLWRSLEESLVNPQVNLPPATTTLTSAELLELAGEYPVGDGWVRVLIEGGQIVIGGEGQAATNLLLGSAAPSPAQSSEQNRAAVEIVRAALPPNPAHPLLGRVNRSPEFRSWLSSRLPAGLPATIRPLGTTPHSSAAGRTQTFIRLGSTTTSPVVRLIWDQDRVVAWGDGIRLPAIARYHPTGPTTVVAFRPRDPAWRTITLTRDAGRRKVSVEFTVR